MDRLLVLVLERHLEHAEAVVLEQDLVMLRRCHHGVQRRIPGRRVGVRGIGHSWCFLPAGHDDGSANGGRRVTSRQAAARSPAQGASPAISTETKPCRRRRAEDHDQPQLLVAGVERRVDHAGRDEDGIAGAEDALLAVDPLLEPARDDEEDLLLVGVLVEGVPLARDDLASMPVICSAPVDEGWLSQRNVPKGNTSGLTSPSILNLLLMTVFSF